MTITDNPSPIGAPPGRPIAFAVELRALVDQLGTNEAAKVSGTSRRSLQLWMSGKGNPNRSTQAGVLMLLSEGIWAKEARAKAIPIP